MPGPLVTGILAAATAALFGLNSAEAVEHAFDGEDINRVKNQVVSAMLDEHFALTTDTQYKLIFTKAVNLKTVRIGKVDYGTPGMLQVFFTVVSQSGKTRLSAACSVSAEESQASLYAEQQQPKYNSWLQDFFGRLTSKIENGLSSSH